MDLFLVRHAEAYERDAGRWPDDRLRPLRPLGARKFRSAARGLSRVGIVASAVWTSRLVRARQTADLLREESGWPRALDCALLEEDLSPMRVLRAIAAASDLDSLALVGHAPGLDELAAYLLLGRGAPSFFRLRKGGMACLRFDARPRAGGASLLWLSPAGFLRALDV